jgi:hypothetical protein
MTGFRFGMRFAAKCDKILFISKEPNNKVDDHGTKKKRIRNEECDANK